MKDYKETLNLPKTSFPMKANLTQREPELLKHWDSIKAYEIMTEHNTELGSYVLHDGPPYANGHLHMGHALNKVLKDIIVKSRNIQGYKAKYVPGWDCHGLPIELKVEHSLGDKKDNVPSTTIRRLCREYAMKWIDIQRNEFKRMGVFGAWDNPYISMAPAYEAATARELGNFMGSNSLTRSKKPIHWCGSCHTALAEAEVEYSDHKSYSIYVRFPILDSKLSEIFPGIKAQKSWVVIWTTTPWTLPSNQAVAVNPEFDYSLIEVAGEYYVLATDLLEDCAKLFSWESFNIIGSVKGERLEGLEASHPFYDRKSPFVLGSHVTLDAGTGCVHTAPGHGREDYDVGVKYNLEILSPIDENGLFFNTEPLVGGKNLSEANEIVISKLKDNGSLLNISKFSHSYPHCWRCKEPVFFRATTQWFISMEKNSLRKKALDAIRNDVNWIPAWGEERIYSMIENRPDWCISRQRAWGVPITALLCKNCGEPWYSAEWNAELADKFANHPSGCDYWFEKSVEELAPSNLTCPHCNSSTWEKETDILDVWFDSGTSFAAVLEQRNDTSFPADLYLEGSDQHRGWFHSSLLASIGTRGVPPYKAVLTHGYVVDGEGKKMSKSVGNIIAPEEIIKKHGAEILRMWAASVEYREDIKISDEIINRQVDAYRRIRNTCRYLLGNLGDFNPSKLLPIEELDPLDRYAIHVTIQAHKDVQQAYTNYEFHKVFHTLHNLCAVDLSSLYLDILKDRLYASGANESKRRSAQTALWHILMYLTLDMSPILSFTSEEVFMHIPEELRPNASTIFGLSIKDLKNYSLTQDEKEAWDAILKVRSFVTASIEPMRKSGEIGHSLDASLTIYLSSEYKKLFDFIKTELRAVFLVSQLEILSIDKAPASSLFTEDLEGVKISLSKAKGEKCARCWIYSTELSTNEENPGICPRCYNVLSIKD